MPLTSVACGPHAPVPLGDLEARDASAFLVWSLVKDDRKLLSPAKGALGMEGAKLVEPLMELVERVRGWLGVGRRARRSEGGGVCDLMHCVGRVQRALIPGAAAKSLVGSSSRRGTSPARCAMCVVIGERRLRSLLLIPPKAWLRRMSPHMPRRRCPY